MISKQKLKETAATLSPDAVRSLFPDCLSVVCLDRLSHARDVEVLEFDPAFER